MMFEYELTDWDDDRLFPRYTEMATEFTKTINGYMYKRLIDFNVDPDVLLNQMQEIRRLNDILEEYKNLEEQGLLLRLPCKVGGAVYKISRKKVKECEVVFVGISADEKCSYFNFVENYSDGTFCRSYSNVFNVIGDTVFLTREEAEAKLKEMESGN